MVCEEKWKFFISPLNKIAQKRDSNYIIYMNHRDQHKIYKVKLYVIFAVIKPVKLVKIEMSRNIKASEKEIDYDYFLFIHACIISPFLSLSLSLFLSISFNNLNNVYNKI